MVIVARIHTRRLLFFVQTLLNKNYIKPHAVGGYRVPWSSDSHETLAGIEFQFRIENLVSLFSVYEIKPLNAFTIKYSDQTLIQSNK